MARKDCTRLSPSATDALELLRDPLEEADGLTRSTAVERLTDDAFERADARELVDELLSKGYFYAVDDELYVTPTDR
jgi:hypothetical protein